MRPRRARKAVDVSELRTKLGDLAERAIANNTWRQRRCVNLIPSEQTPSTLVKMFEIGDAAGRYAEHRSQKGNEIYYYQGIDFIREVEEEAARELGTYFGCSDVELRPISGQMSNEVVFKAMLKWLARSREGLPRMRRVVNNDLNKGGHLSAQPMGALFNFVDLDSETGKEAVTNFPVREDNPYRCDVDALLAMLPDVRPDLVIFGKSMFLHPEPVRQVRDLVADWEDRPVLMYDMAHVLGLCGAFQEPFADGADLVTGSTHKTFFGPQRGVVAGNMPKGHPLRKLWIDIRSRAFPGSTSNHHLGTLLALLAASYEMNAFKSEYQSAVRTNAKAFARALLDAGITVEGDPSIDYTETHQVICRVREHGIGEDIAARLERNNIVVNYQALPDDTSFVESSGIRLGVAEMTRFGMEAKDFTPLAKLMADVILRDRDVADDVAELRAGFREMRYCLPPGDAAELGAQLLSSMLPQGAYTEAFATQLVKAAAAV
jgi:glycine/serine hydroxymethyltransferase